MQEQWKDWGARLMGLAQGGLYYGPDNEPFRADMRRVREIAEELQRNADHWDPEQQKAWGVEVHRISDLSLVRELICNQYDLNRCLSLREVAEEMEEEVPLRAWNEWKLRSERNK